MSSTPSVPSSKPVADTGYLLCFGSVPAGRGLLRELHPAGLCAPDAVHNELDGLPRSRDRGVAMAAQVFSGRGRAQVEKVPFEPADGALREELLDELHAHESARSGRSSARDPSSTKNLGEAECVCLCLRRKALLLCNDNGGRQVAAARRVPVVTVAEDLRRLSGDEHTPKQLFRLAKEMERQVGDLGAVVGGQAFFRTDGRDARTPRPPAVS